MNEVCISQSSMEETFNSLMDNKDIFRFKKINVFEAPEFVQRLKTFLEIETGKSATFVGYYRGTPPPTVTWVREDEVLCNSDKHIIVTDQTSGCSVLTITHVNRKDEGPYKCRLENKEGSASSTGYLSIIAPKSRRSKKKGGSAARVSSPPVLKSIQEQAVVEEKEEQEYFKMPPSPLKEFIAAIRHSARSMNSAINYGNLENVAEETGLEDCSPMDNDVFHNRDHYMNGDQKITKRTKSHSCSDDEMSAGESSSSESEATSKRPHYSSLSQLLGLDSVSQVTTGLNGDIKSSQQMPQARPTSSIRITTASRNDTAPQSTQRKTSDHSPSFKQSFNSSNDKLDLYIKTNNLSNIISPKITASRPQQLDTTSSFQQKQLQKLQQIQDFKLQKQQLRLQHQQLQEQLKKKEIQFMEQNLKQGDAVSPSEQRPLKLGATTPTSIDSSTESSLQASMGSPVGNAVNSNSERKRRNSIEIKVVSKDLKDSFMNSNKPVSVKSSLIISTSGGKQNITITNNNTNICNTTNNTNTNSNNNNSNNTPSLLDELTTTWISNPFFYVQLSFVIGVSLAALATNSHPLTVVAIVTLASLLAFSQIPQLVFSLADNYISPPDPKNET